MAAQQAQRIRTVGRILAAVAIGGTGCHWLYRAHQDYEFIYSGGYSNSPEFDKGRKRVEVYLRHPKTNELVLVLPLPAVQTLKFYGKIITDLWITDRLLQKPLPMIILPGIQTEYNEGSRVTQRNHEAFAGLPEDTTRSFFTSWTTGRWSSHPERKFVHFEDYLLPFLVHLGFPHIYGDLFVGDLQPQTQVFLLNLSGSLGRELELLPRDSPLWKDLVERRVVAGIQAFQAIRREIFFPTSRKPSGSWWKQLFSVGREAVPPRQPVPQLYVFPWHQRLAPGLIWGLQQLGFQEVAQNERKVYVLPFIRFLKNRFWGGQVCPTKAELDEKVHRNHNEMLTRVQ
eukprot:RCo020704